MLKEINITISRVNLILAGIPATVCSGVFLILHFILPVAGIGLPADPAWLAVFVSGFPILYDAVDHFVAGRGIHRLTSSFLICIAMTAAIIIDDLFAAGEVAVIMAIGGILEEMTINRAKKGVTKLLSLAPTMGRRLTDDGEEMIPAEEIKRGDILRIFPGEAVPADGKIIRGETSIDQSLMTGESLPVDKGIGDEVYCGTINRFGSVDIEATDVGEDSSLQKMVRMVQEADNQKAPTQRTVDKYASLMVPASVTIALVAFVFTHEITRAVTVLLVFCPCALTLATPTAIMAAIGQATKHGVLIKSGEALEAMGHVDTITFDKTGTLTRGTLEVNDIIPFGNLNEMKPEEMTENNAADFPPAATSADRLLEIAASAESRSEHPLGKAVLACARKRDIKIRDTAKFQMMTGKGVCAEIDGHEVFCGSERFLEENGITVPEAAQKEADYLRSQGKAMILVAESGSLTGIISLSDVIRPETRGIVFRLRDMGTDVVLLTGDHLNTAAWFADQAGISQIHAELLPAEKVSHILEMKQEGRTVCMVGDGVNDAPALKAADVGIAMGSLGSDIAIETADIALMKDDLTRLPYLKRLSVATVSTIRISITAAMVINTIALILSVLGMLSPTMGALVHNVGSCLVVIFAGMLYDRKLDDDEK